MSKFVSYRLEYSKISKALNALQPKSWQVLMLKEHNITHNVYLLIAEIEA